MGRRKRKEPMDLADKASVWIVKRQFRWGDKLYEPGDPFDFAQVKGATERRRLTTMYNTGIFVRED